jgi:polysaccharide pyruvyl transferase WcaK-like protein
MNGNNSNDINVIFSYLLLSNIGCEIILRGTVAFFNRALPGYKINFTIPSYHPESDRKLLSDLDNVTVVPMLRWKRYARGFLSKTGLNKKFWTPRFSSSFFRDADLFISVGGDIYTMFGNTLPRDWIGYENFATKHDIPSLMFGANMERFEILAQEEKEELVSHLNRFKLIAVRDKGTKDYLEEYNVRHNVQSFPDPTFSLRPVTRFDRKKIKTIGVNFTPIMIRDFGENIVIEYAKLIAELVERGYTINLIPHVHSVDGNAGVDDRLSIDKLYERLPQNVKSKVNVYQGDMSLKAISIELQKIDLFIGARMHGCLNSLTLGKAVCFLGYSKKAQTMVDTLKNIMPFKEVAQSFVAIAADKLSVEDVERLIKNHNDWALKGDQPVIIETQKYLDSLTIWPDVRSVLSAE